MINLQEINQNLFKIDTMSLQKGDFDIIYYSVFRSVDSINIKNKYTGEPFFPDPIHYTEFTNPSGSFDSLDELGEYLGSIIALGTNSVSIIYENSANKQNSMIYDGTGVKYPTVDAVNTQANNLLKVASGTGFIDFDDTFNMVLTSPTLITVAGSNPGTFIKSRLFVPPFVPIDAIKNITSRTLLAASISLPSDGRYFRFLGYDYNTDSIVDSSTGFFLVNDIVALGVVELLRSGGVNTFTSFQMQLDVSTVSLFDLTMSPNQTTSNISPNNNLTAGISGGVIKSCGISWGSSNPHIKVVPANGITPFIRIDPAYLTTTTGYPTTTTVDTTTYWNGISLVSTGNNNSASVQRWLLHIDGRIFLQAGEQTFSTLAAAELAATTVVFSDIIPSELVIELCRMASVKITSDLSNTTQTQFYYGGNGGTGAGGGTSFSTLGGSPYDNTLLGIELNNKTSISTSLNINGNSYNLSSSREWRVGEGDTGLIDFGGIIQSSSTTINIGPAVAFIVDNETNPEIPTYVRINYPGENNKTVTTIGSGLSTYVMLSPSGSGSGVISFQNTFPTSPERKTKVWLGKIGHPSGSITTVGNEPDSILSPIAQHRDLSQDLGYRNIGIYTYPNGSNLNINLTQGYIGGDGINFVNSKTNPNRIVMGPLVAAQFLYRTQIGGATGLVTTMDPGNYDVGGVVTPIPGAGSRCSNQYIFIVPGAGIIIQYGQNYYNSITEAIAAINKETFLIYSNLPNNAVLINAVSIRKDATLLNDLNQAQFFRANKLGETNGSTAGVSISTLQSAFNNSLVPQIEVPDSLGPLTIKSARSSNTGSIQEWQNISGSTTARITGNGDITGNSFIKSGGSGSQCLMADGTTFDLLTNQIEVSGSNTTQLSWNGKEVTFMTSGLHTIPNTLTAQFSYDLAADDGVTVTWAITAPFTWRVAGLAVGVAPPSMTAGQFCTVSRRIGTNEIRVRGL